MCGICGIYRFDDKQDDELFVNSFRKLLFITESRGEDAAGVCTISKNKLDKNTIRILKKAVPSSDFIGEESFKKLMIKAKSARFIIGHCRKKTHGTQRENVNNHPILDKETGIALIHNGVLSNHKTISKKDKLELDGECDSEVVLRTIINDGLPDAIAKFSGSVTFAIANINESEKLILYRSVSPLIIAYLPELNWIVFASEEKFIEYAFSREEDILNFFKRAVPTTEIIYKKVENNTLISLQPNQQIEHEKIKAGTNNDYSSYQWDGGVYSGGYKNNRVSNSWDASDYNKKRNKEKNETKKPYKDIVNDMVEGTYQADERSDEGIYKSIDEGIETTSFPEDPDEDFEESDATGGLSTFDQYLLPFPDPFRCNGCKNIYNCGYMKKCYSCKLEKTCTTNNLREHSRSDRKVILKIMKEMEAYPCYSLDFLIASNSGEMSKEKLRRLFNDAETFI